MAAKCSQEMWKTDLTSWTKDSFIMWSASSIAKKSTWLRSSRSFFTKSVSLPTVPITMCTPQIISEIQIYSQIKPFLMKATSSLEATPPTNSLKRLDSIVNNYISAYPILAPWGTNFLTVSLICPAISRVGAMIIFCGSLVSRIRCSMARIEKTRVLPVPDFACTNISEKIAFLDFVNFINPVYSIIKTVSIVLFFNESL